MPYTAQISRANPTCFLFLIDQSGSMDDPFSGTSRKKSEFLADTVNRSLKELTLQCASGRDIRDYYHVGVVGYGGKGVASAFTGQLFGRDLVPLSEIATKPLRVDERPQKVEDGTGGFIETKVKLPVWFDAVADGGTPMIGALSKAQSIITNWLSTHADCYPPIVINLTDGEQTDGEQPDVVSAADSLKRLSSNDGNVLLFNAHISSSSANPIEFPDKQDYLADEFARMLFEISSVLPEQQMRYAKERGLPVNDRSRAFVFNANMYAVNQFLEVGTKVATKLLR